MHRWTLLPPKLPQGAERQIPNFHIIPSRLSIENAPNFARVFEDFSGFACSENGDHWKVTGHLHHCSLQNPEANPLKNYRRRARSIVLRAPLNGGKRNWGVRDICLPRACAHTHTTQMTHMPSLKPLSLLCQTKAQCVIDASSDLGARLRGRTTPHTSKKGSEKGLRKGLWVLQGFWEWFSEGVLRRGFPEGA